MLLPMFMDAFIIRQARPSDFARFCIVEHLDRMILFCMFQGMTGYHLKTPYLLKGWSYRFI
jgi:hypothetical protein